MKIGSCSDIQNNGYPNGFYSFAPSSPAVPINVFCSGGAASYFAPINAIMPVNYFSLDS